eukprot:GAHX01006044.1.p1 GENE.GAHX01006044.1~~GAHX01006044.1.p1  ORF type:complete len:50 (+),score=0.67 GAHX01006044.1:374-523(+)
MIFVIFNCDLQEASTFLSSTLGNHNQRNLELLDMLSDRYILKNEVNVCD